MLIDEKYSHEQWFIMMLHNNSIKCEEIQVRLIMQSGYLNWSQLYCVLYNYSFSRVRISWVYHVWFIGYITCYYLIDKLINIAYCKMGNQICIYALFYSKFYLCFFRQREMRCYYKFYWKSTPNLVYLEFHLKENFTHLL